MVLWIDTICIDQQNADEKALQIPLMGEIYRRATEVTIWLGEGDRKMTRCLILQKRIPFGSYRILRALPVRCLRPTFFLLFGGTRPEDLKAFRNFEWQKRQWTLQELLLTRHPVVMVGHSKLGWHEFLCFVQNVLHTVSCSGPRYLKDDFQLRFWSDRNFMWLFNQMISTSDSKSAEDRGVLPSLLPFLVKAVRFNSCSNARDKVYALYGILNDHVDKLPPVNYSEDPKRVLEEFTRAMIASSRIFWPALVQEWLEEPPDCLPSWVINLNTPLGGTLHLDASFLEFNNLTNKTLGFATLDSKINLQTLQTSRPGSVSLKGKQYTTVALLSSRWPQIYATNEHGGLNEALECFLSWLVFTISDDLMSSKHQHAPGPALFGVIMLASTREVFDRLRKAFNEVGPICIQLIFADEAGQDPDTGRRIQQILETDGWREIQVHFNHRLSSQPIIFRTATGDLGITSARIEQDDTIVLLAGCNWPVILRKDENNWRFIGRAGILGIMQGEAWFGDTNTDDLETFALI